MVMEAQRASDAPPSSAGVRGLLQLARPGLRFSEVMTGMITMGSTDPIEGYGNDAAIAVTLRAVVTVPNLPAFVRDPNHRGRWSATGSIPVLGGDVSTTGVGDFRLFQRAIGAKGGVREMVYDTVFSVGNQTLVMRGRKFIEPSPPWRGWRATTTLLVRLFPLGTGDAVPVAAGILRLSPWAFIRQLMSMRITGDFSLFEQGRQLFSFYRFFVSALIRTYLKGRRW